MMKRGIVYLAAFLALTGPGLLVVRQPAVAQNGKVTETPGETIPVNGTPYFLPLVDSAPPPTPTPTQPPRTFGSVEVEGGSLGRPAAQSPDVNLSLRGYAVTDAYLGLVNYNGATDDQAPQAAGMFSPPRLPGFSSAYQVYDWNWGCNPPDGCRGGLLTNYGVTLLALATAPGEPIAIPSRGPSIMNDYKAMVLYAEENRITFTYTRGDSPAVGYLVHVEDIAVAPDLLALYRQLDAAGRHRLPALHNGEIFGVAGSQPLKLAIRDTGEFMDPRSCKDWWTGYMAQCVVQIKRPAVGNVVKPAAAPGRVQSEAGRSR